MLFVGQLNEASDLYNYANCRQKISGLTSCPNRGKIRQIGLYFNKTRKHKASKQLKISATLFI